jgi:hypothetical protein
VVGGYVYRGSELSGDLVGRYVFGVFSKGEDSPSGQLFVASDEDESGDDLWPVQHLAVSDAADGSLPYLLKGFGQDGAGELYLLVSSEAGPAGSSGEVIKLTPP